MRVAVCLRGPRKPLASPFGGGAYVLTLLCGHLWSWNVDRQGEFPAEVDCIHCDRDELVRLGAELPSPFASPLSDAVIKYRAEQAQISQKSSIDEKTPEPLPQRLIYHCFLPCCKACQSCHHYRSCEDFRAEIGGEKPKRIV